MSIFITPESRPTKGFVNLIKRNLFKDKEGNTKKFVENDCIKTMLDHEGGRATWSVEEKKKCGDLYEQNAFKGVLDLKEEEGSSPEVIEKNKEIKKMQDGIKAVYKRDCYKIDHKYNYPGLCSNAFKKLDNKYDEWEMRKCDTKLFPDYNEKCKNLYFDEAFTKDADPQKIYILHYIRYCIGQYNEKPINKRFELTWEKSKEVRENEVKNNKFKKYIIPLLSRNIKKLNEMSNLIFGHDHIETPFPKGEVVEPQKNANNNVADGIFNLGF